MQETPATADDPAKPFQTPPKCGLSSEQVLHRQANGLINQVNLLPTRTVGRILAENLLTLFNLIHVVLAAFIFSVGAYRNALFMGVVLANAAVGIVQEIRAKRALDRLYVLIQPGADVLRNGVSVHLSANKIVMDDLVLLSAGQQVLCDGIIREAQGIEVDESMLTGEAEPVRKRAGDRVYSGSFVVSGAGSMQVTHVGDSSYAASITAKARVHKKAPSELMDGLNQITKILTFIIIPVGLMLFVSKTNLSDEPVSRAVVGTVAGIVGMIPEGLVLLTSVSLALAAIKLANRHMLVQSLPSIETLARIDTLCLDKTGTITSSNLTVTAIIPLDAACDTDDQAAAALAHHLPGENRTQRALQDYFHQVPGWEVEQMRVFSSARKWSGAAFKGHGSWVLGAPELVMPGLAGLPQLTENASQGKRVLLLAHTECSFPDGGELPESLHPHTLIVLENHIREHARQTLDYFAGQGVAVKVISGDNALAVSSIAKRAGVKGADRYIDMSMMGENADFSQLTQEYMVFGRVSPEQKMHLIAAMKKDGHTVGMVGDGVNDVLALHEADCSIAMASGSDAARSVASLILMDSDLASLVYGVAEGRRVFNNIGRVATMFLVKTVFSLLLSILYIFLPMPYPLLPIQVTLISTLAKGIPSFFLALEPNHARIKQGFLKQILYGALPPGIAAAIAVLSIQYIGIQSNLPGSQINTLCAFAVGVISFIVLFRMSMPWNWKKSILFGSMALSFIAAFVWASAIFQLEAPALANLWVYPAVIGFCMLLERLYKLGLNLMRQKKRK